MTLNAVNHAHQLVMADAGMLVHQHVKMYVQGVQLFVIHLAKLNAKIILVIHVLNQDQKQLKFIQSEGKREFLLKIN